MSLQGRLAGVSVVVLGLFLGLTGLALERAFREAGTELVHERLMVRVYALLAAAELKGEDGVQMRNAVVDPRLEVPGSGVVARVADAQGNTLWRSPSALGVPPAWPEGAAPGQPSFQAVQANDGSERFAVSFTVYWEIDPQRVQRLRFEVAESRETFDASVSHFRRALWSWLGVVAVLLLLAQVGVLRWGLAPLRRLRREVRQVRAGRRETVSETLPPELKPLAAALNDLIRTGQGLIERHRNALGDLAHSLKTPLAVLRTARGQSRADETLRETLAEQVERIDRSVEYHLRRTSGAGGRIISGAVDVAGAAERLRETMRKVHAARDLEIMLDVAPECVFPGEENDFLEMTGNLMDNACKWARSRVRLRIGPDQDGRLFIEVEDDGPGILPADRQRLMARGARTDEEPAGHGIGLAIVRDLACGTYGGSIEIDESSLGGARFRVKLARAA